MWEKIRKTCVPGCVLPCANTTRSRACLCFRTRDLERSSCPRQPERTDRAEQLRPPRNPGHFRASSWSLGFLVREVFAAFAAIAFVFVRIISRILTGLGIVFFVIFTSLVGFLYCSENVRIFDYKTPFSLFFGSEEEEVPEWRLREVLI